MKTWLFVPGHESRMLEKALGSEADVVIVDWEDAVPDHKKEEARSVTRAILTSKPSRPRLTLRVNCTRTNHYANDIAALAGLPLSAIMLSKPDEPAEVQDLTRVGLPIIPLIESALSVENAFQIAKVHPLVERLALGAMDLIADLGAQWRPDGEAIQYARARLLIAGRAARLQGAIDGVYPKLYDLDGLKEEAMTARRLGFVGKLVIHPQQICVVQEVFTPTQAEIEQAKYTINTFDAALATGRSAIRIKDDFIDPPMVNWARNVLRMAGEENGQ